MEYSCRHGPKKGKFSLMCIASVEEGRSSVIRHCTIYITFIRSGIEYASPVWSSIPKSLSDLLESVQKRALKIACPALSYDESLKTSSLQRLSIRRDVFCKKFIESLLRENSPHNPLTKIMEINPRTETHNYDLRNDQRIDQTLIPVMTERFRNFVTRKYF